MTRTASVHNLAPPSAQELVERARELAPLVRKNAAAGEANRRVEEETIQAVKKAGLMKVCTPKRYGGWEMNTRAMLDVGAAVGEADGGSAWVVNLNNICCWLDEPVSRQGAGRGFRRRSRCLRVRRAQPDGNGEEGGRRVPHHRCVALQFCAAGTPNGPCSACRLSTTPAKRSIRDLR